MLFGTKDAVMGEKIKWSEWALVLAILISSCLFAIGPAVVASELSQFLGG